MFEKVLNIQGKTFTIPIHFKRCSKCLWLCLKGTEQCPECNSKEYIHPLSGFKGISSKDRFNEPSSAYSRKKKTGYRGKRG